MSQPALCASPPASDAAENRSRPAMNNRRRPSRSAIRPPRSRKPPKVRTYPLTNHDRSACEKLRSFPIEGSATFTIEASRTTTNWAAASGASARHLLVLLGVIQVALSHVRYDEAPDHRGTPSETLQVK